MCMCMSMCVCVFNKPLRLKQNVAQDQLVKRRVKLIWIQSFPSPRLIALQG